ncbi:hypothetical protein J6590_085183 [Homalodisca vitripennis]|nr:hypothetical protein J6590_085183 [Homalodisca vitripennis]
MMPPWEKRSSVPVSQSKDPRGRLSLKCLSTVLPSAPDKTGAPFAQTWALMELFWTNERAAMAARPARVGIFRCLKEVFGELETETLSQ